MASIPWSDAKSEKYWLERDDGYTGMGRFGLAFGPCRVLEAVAIELGP
jgi:hypothetical protein